MTRTAWAMLIGAGATVYLAAGWAGEATGPGGLFEQRLREAQQRAQATRKPAQPAPNRTAPRPQPARTTHAAPHARSAPRVAARPASRPVTRTVRRPPTPTVTRATAVTTAQRVDRGFREVTPPAYEAPRRQLVCYATYSIDPQGDRPGGNSLTGDLVLFSSPYGLPVRFQWDGGSRTASETVVLKEILPQNLKVTAQVPGQSRRCEVHVPVKSGCITTVRFVFRTPRPAGEDWR